MSNIVVYQIDCKIYLMKNLKLENVLSEIATYVDKALVKNEQMVNFHNSRGYKNYVFSGFKELEMDKVYKEGKIYSFSIRCIEEELKKFFVQELSNVYTGIIKGLATTEKTILKKHIQKLYLVTPGLIKLEDGYWKKNLSFEEFEKRLFSNAIKKYKQIAEENVDENFILYNRIIMINEKPIATKYKEIKLLGDKFELDIANNEMAQRVAYVLLGTGILENNARGYGFANYKIV